MNLDGTIAGKKNLTGNIKYSGSGDGLTQEQVEQIKKNTEDIRQLSATIDDLLENPPSSGGATTEQITEIINTALAQAKESGEFNGKDGEDGYTPIKGTDYFTDADKQGFVTDVLNALPTWTRGNY